MTSDPKSGQKLRTAVDTLSLKYAEEGTSNVAAVIDTFLVDEVAADIVQSIVSDAVFRFLLASALQIRRESVSLNFDDALERFVLQKTRLTGDLAKSLRQNLKQAVLASEEERPKTERKNRIKDKQKSKNCYLCSSPINEESVLDHVWPRSAGGGNGKSNLRLAHPFCEAIKADLAVFGDAPVGRFAFTKLPRTLAGAQMHWWPSRVENAEDFQSLIDDIRGSQLKIAILGRQNFECDSCDKHFADSIECSIVRRDPTEPWWFANVIAICDECGTKHE